jgi:DNA invertase Pin-like site-specific DNA recombinase
MSTATPARPRKKPSLDTITASLVARQSRTDDGSMSVADQIDAMRAWCAKQTPPVEVHAVYEETDVSGRKPLTKRHGLKRAVDDVEQGASQMILTAYFDRFVRSVATRAEVLVRVEAVNGVVMTLDMGLTSNATPVSKFSGTVLAAASELIAEQAGEKTAVTKQRNIDKGIPPFPRITPAYERIESGKHKGRLRPHPTNGPLIREACKMRARGVSYTKITEWLIEQGLQITPTGVETTLGSRLLIGEIHFGSFTPNLRAIDKPIIDRATFARMHKAHVSRGRYGKNERLLARQDLLRCGTCNGRMSVQSTSNAKSGKTYAYYRCGNRLCAHPALIAAGHVEDAVRDEAIELSKAYKGRASDRADLEAARLALADVDERLSATIETLAITGVAGHAAARRTLDELHAEHEAAVARHGRLLARSSTTREVRTATDWNNPDFTLERKRGVIHATIARIVVAPHTGPNPGPRVAPGRVKIESRTLSSE